MSVTSTTTAILAAAVTAAGIVYGPELITPEQLVVECRAVTVAYGDAGAVQVILNGCRSSTGVPVAIVVPETPPA